MDGLSDFGHVADRTTEDGDKTCSKTLVLKNGSYMPAIAIGTRKCSTPGTIYKAVKAALVAGFRHIDTYVSLPK